MKYLDNFCLSCTNLIYVTILLKEVTRGGVNSCFTILGLASNVAVTFRDLPGKKCELVTPQF